jgi:organic radical activating enzyme
MASQYSLYIPAGYSIEREQIPAKTLQIFITSVCNKKCRGCFYASHMKGEHMPLKTYKDLVTKAMAQDQIQKIVLMGGEPTLHPRVNEMILLNRALGLKTTIYTNGTVLQKIHRQDSYEDLTIRVGVLGLSGVEKSLDEVGAHGHKIEICLMVRRDNMASISEVARQVERTFGPETPFMTSSIKEIDKTGSFFKNTDESLSEAEYAAAVNTFLEKYDGNLKVLDICKRGAFLGNSEHNRCRFSNILTDLTRITCPLDIAIDIKCSKDGFEDRPCNKSQSCLLQKFRLKKI